MSPTSALALALGAATAVLAILSAAAYWKHIEHTEAHDEDGQS